MYLRKVRMRDFRCFTDTSTNFVVPNTKIDDRPEGYLDNLTVMLGTNGSGKSAILKAACLSLVGDVIRLGGFKPSFLVRRSRDAIESASIDSWISVHDSDLGIDSARIKPKSEKLRLKVSKVGTYEELIQEIPSMRKEFLFDDTSLSSFVVAYGATRRSDVSSDSSYASREKSRSIRYQRIASLFEDYVGLVPLSEWAITLLRRERLDEALESLNHLLPTHVSAYRIGTDGIDGVQVLFNVYGVEGLSFEALSDGYRAFVGVVADLLYHLALVCPPGRKLASIQGVAIIDEIDLHLHPEWQQTVVRSLCQAFPKLQFIVTTHSPLVVSSVASKNVLQTIRTEKGIFVTHVQEQTFGKSSDQLLIGETFGLSSPRSESAKESMQALADVAHESESSRKLYTDSLVNGFEQRVANREARLKKVMADDSVPN
jgi:predicted ATP-binding protein involved in virulence